MQKVELVGGGASGRCRREGGPAPQWASVPQLARAPTQRQPHAPHGACAGLPDAVSTWQRSWLWARASLTAPKTSAEAAVCPQAQLGGGARRLPGPWQAFSGALCSQHAPRGPSFTLLLTRSFCRRALLCVGPGQISSSLGCCDVSQTVGVPGPPDNMATEGLRGLWGAWGAGSTRWGLPCFPQLSQWQLQGWPLLGLPGEFRNPALAHTLQRQAPRPSPHLLPFLCSGPPGNPSHAEGHGGLAALGGARLGPWDRQGS